MSSSTPNSTGRGQPQNTFTVTTTRTQTATQTDTSAPVLRLRGASTSGEGSADINARAAVAGRGRRIQWAEDVVDNEGMGKKKSKGLFVFNILLSDGSLDRGGRYDMRCQVYKIPD